MKKLIILLTFVFAFQYSNAQIDIAEARTMSEGTTVTVRGIATNGGELGIIRYVQDATGGIAVYPGTGSNGNLPSDVVRGTEFEVTGELKVYNGLLEIDPVSSYTVISNNNPLPTPLSGSPGIINEDNEAKLLTVNNITFDDGGSIFSVGSYGFSDGSESSTIYVRSGHPLLGTTIPLATVNLTGISSEFNGNYQLLARDEDDLQIADNFYITESPRQIEIEKNSFTLTWKTNAPGNSNVRFGLTNSLGQEINNAGMTTDHSVTITGLIPGEFYYAQVYSNDGNIDASSTIGLYSTESNSSGSVRVYFNHGVNGNFSNGTNWPTDTNAAALEAAIIDRINKAQTSIDVAMYNVNRSTIIAALSDAYDRGVIVRYIADDETANLALMNPTPNFPVLKGNAGSPLMHNKFYVIDAESETDAWVIMGSTNMTDQNIADDFNNMVVIQDNAIAKAYTIEFEEMWGSDSPSPGVFSVKFGESKTDNTPHLFVSNGTLIESYFSPSDNTAANLSQAVRSADTDLQFALLTFTHNELGNAVVDEHDSGTEVRGIIDNITDQGTEFDYLVNQGVNVTDDNTSTQTHHKYCIIDATDTASDPQVITGSHNWSGSADSRNDENTLIFHSAAISNIFLQEFEARWCEINGGANCITSINELEITGLEINMYPNPTSEVLKVDLSIESKADLVLSIWSNEGRLLESRLLPNSIGKIQEVIPVNYYTEGNYILSLHHGDQVTSRKFTVIK